MDAEENEGSSPDEQNSPDNREGWDSTQGIGPLSTATCSGPYGLELR